eukprot:9133327-Alexandrium_andersonii.AAC.1
MLPVLQMVLKGGGAEKGARGASGPQASAPLRGAQPAPHGGSRRAGLTEGAAPGSDEKKSRRLGKGGHSAKSRRHMRGAVSLAKAQGVLDDPPLGVLRGSRAFSQP